MELKLELHFYASDYEDVSYFVDQLRGKAAEGHPFLIRYRSEMPRRSKKRTVSTFSTPLFGNAPSNGDKSKTK